MIKSKATVKELCLLVILSLLLDACGGGGGAGDNGTENGGGDDNVPPPVSGNLNGGLTGRIFMQDGWIIDVSSGKSRRIPGVVWDDYCYEENFNDDPNNDFFCTLSNPEIERNSYTSYYGTPSLNGDEYLLTVSMCKYGHGSIANSDCLEVRSVETGELLGQRLIRDEIINSGAKFSRNGQYYAYTHSADIVSNTSFIINNKNHEEIAAITMRENDFMPFDWGPSGEIVLSYGDALYITPPYSLDGVKIFDLSDHPELTTPELGTNQNSVSGVAGSVRISPDGSKVAFMLFETSDSFKDIPKTPWIMNIDGTDIHRLAHTSVSSVSNNLFGSLAWSPDGKFIMINEGYHHTIGVGEDYGADYLYAIPSESRDVELNKEGRSGIIVINTNYRIDNQEILDIFYGGSGFWWLP
jgi:hypothetical protein